MLRLSTHYFRMTQQDRTSELVIVTGFMALSYLFNIPVLGQLALVLGFIFLISDFLSKGILWLWWKLAHILGWINTRILLSVVFYVILLPMAMLSRIFTRDPLKIKWRKHDSTFVIRDHLYSRSDLENPW